MDGVNSDPGLDNRRNQNINFSISSMPSVQLGIGRSKRTLESKTDCLTSDHSTWTKKGLYTPIRP
jgi:hypothetical protein